MPAYVIADVRDARDPEALAEYRRRNTDAVARRAVGHEDHLTVAVRERVEAERQPLDGQDVSQSRARRGRGASPRR